MNRQKGELKSFSDLIPSINIACLDINLILKLFWSINYFKGVIVVYNYALQDYKTPIEEFVRYIDEVPKDKIESSVINTFLIYLHSSLGKFYLCYIFKSYLNKRIPLGMVPLKSFCTP